MEKDKEKEVKNLKNIKNNIIQIIIRNLFQIISQIKY